MVASLLASQSAGSDAQGGTLLALSLSENPVGAKGGLAIAGALRVNNALRELNWAGG